MAELLGTFRRPFKEQVAAFRLRLADLRPTSRWIDVWQAEHDRAFMVAGALKADLLADLAGAVQKAIEDGTSLEQFRADFRQIVARRGWHGWTGEGTTRGEAWRTKVIYKTNMATTYAAGRWAQLKATGYPLLVYRHGGSLDPRVEHLSWDGLILPADHPFWTTHAPPNGWGCSCFVTGARSESDAVRKGGKPGKRLPDGWAVLSPKTGAPAGIDRGWAYAPGASVAETIAQIAGKRPQLPGAISEALAKVVPNLPEPPPPVMPADPDAPLDWRAWPKTKTLAQVAEAARRTGVADSIILRKSLPVAGADAYLRMGAEITQRFGLPPLSYFASADDLPFKVRGAGRAAAFYVSSRKAMGVKAKGITPRLTEAAFGTEEPPSVIARWYDELLATATEVQRLARMMQPRQWSIVRDVRGVAAHEWGHHFHYSQKAEIDALVTAYQMMSEGWPKLISRYSGTNREEFIAESFTLYMMGDETQFFRIHPQLLAYFRRKDRLNG